MGGYLENYPNNFEVQFTAPGRKKTHDKQQTGLCTLEEQALCALEEQLLPSGGVPLPGSARLMQAEVGLC